MATITPFGDMKFGDTEALAKWLDAHDRRHMQYVKAFHVPGGTLDGPVNGDWMLRHTMRHVRLATLAGKPLRSADTKVLALPGEWRTEREFGDWHDLHNRLHSHIDRSIL